MLVFLNSKSFLQNNTDRMLHKKLILVKVRTAMAICNIVMSFTHINSIQ